MNISGGGERTEFEGKQIMEKTDLKFQGEGGEWGGVVGKFLRNFQQIS